jgi:hypothetical protein
MDYSTCEPKKSGLSQISESIYGRYFWEQALTRAKELARSSTFENFLQESDRRTQQNDQRMEELYRKHPQIAPSSAERTALRLRDQADRIEAQAGLDRVISMQRDIRAKASNCVQEITQRLR